MTAEEFARLLNARRVGKGKWIARCVAHPDRNPSLSICIGKKVPVVLKCMSNGCDTRSILDAMGLRWGDLFDGKPTPEMRQRLRDSEWLAKLERKSALAGFASVMFPEERNYWRVVERNCNKDIQALRFKLFPEEKQEYDLQQRIKAIGFTRMWEGIPEL